MIGEGFLGQMHDTMKKNREMVRAALGKKKRKPFDNGEYPTTNSFILKDKKRLSNEEKAILIEHIRKENRRADIRRVLLLIFVLAFFAFLIFGLPLLHERIYK